MLPIRDDNPTVRSTVLNWAIIAVTVAVYLLVQPRSEGELASFLYAEATIPCEVLTAEPLSIPEIEQGTCGRGGDPLFAEKPIWWSLVASIFFHGGLFHLVGNLWMLWIFGNNIEDELGHVRYLVFYLVSGVLASLAHVALNPRSTIPLVGASGAIAAVMGAYLVLHPRARVTSIIPPLFFLPFRVPAAVFLVLWFVGQFAIDTSTGVAWEAHVGGFAVGAAYAWRLRRAGRLERQIPT
ncbi:MAG: rhomboid family intramembrane serine protease [Acidimicrobiia bacterium]|nr:rhomboid family intramembrane serine protease [Acidimicrobiia bacterium]MDH4307649.1 rhomboid family intramembrane serine protease [Acidimicrobiia bacterium]MDH5294255.1 rhomboid family intramembrane serine protease [Acidimicrobiia bacterium]